MKLIFSSLLFTKKVVSSNSNMNTDISIMENKNKIISTSDKAKNSIDNKNKSTSGTDKSSQDNSLINDTSISRGINRVNRTVSSPINLNNLNSTCTASTDKPKKIQQIKSTSRKDGNNNIKTRTSPTLGTSVRGNVNSNFNLTGGVSTKVADVVANGSVTSALGDNVNSNMKTVSGVSPKLASSDANGNPTSPRLHTRRLTRDDSGFGSSGNSSDDGDGKCPCGVSSSAQFPDRQNTNHKILSRSASLTSLDSAFFDISVKNVYDCITLKSPNTSRCIGNLNMDRNIDLQPASASSSMSSLSSFSSWCSSRTSLSCCEHSRDSLNVLNLESGSLTCSPGTSPSQTHTLNKDDDNCCCSRLSVKTSVEISNSSKGDSKTFCPTQDAENECISESSESFSDCLLRNDINERDCQLTGNIKSRPLSPSSLSLTQVYCTDDSATETTVSTCTDSPCCDTTDSNYPVQLYRRSSTAAIYTSDDNDVVSPKTKRETQTDIHQFTLRSRTQNARNTTASEQNRRDLNNNSGQHDRRSLRSFLPSSPGRLYDYLHQNGIICLVALIMYTLLMVVADACISIMINAIKAAIGKQELKEMRKSLSNARRSKRAQAASG